MKRWGWIEVGAEVLGAICAVVSLFAEAKNTEDLDDQIRRVINEDNENKEEN